METKGAPAPANRRIRRGLRYESSLGVGGYGLAVDVEERE